MAGYMAQSGTIEKRKVFYLGGFDPRGAGFYYGLYKKEAENYSKRTGIEVDVTKRKKSGTNYSWKIRAEDTKTDYEFLKWDDIVRKNWSKNPVLLYLKAFRTYFYYLLSGTVSSAYKIAWEPVLTFIYPLLLIASVILSSFTAGFAAYRLSPIAAPFAALAVLYLANLKLTKSNAYWLMQLYNYTHDFAGRDHTEFKNRMNEFAKLVEKDLASEDYDEVILSAHSNGTICLMHVLPELSKSPHFKKLKVLTLGQIVPLLSLLPKAKEFRKLVRETSGYDIFWLDVTAPSDGACFAFTGPFIGVCPNHNSRLKLISARFHKMFDAEKYNRVKRDKRQTHFLYLMAADNNTEYDYFAITTGNISLEKRFADVPVVTPRKKVKSKK